MSKLAVIFGGSGFVGRNVVRELAKRGWRVRVAVRRPHLAGFLRPMGAVGQIQLFQANVRYPQTVARALDGADAVVNLTGILAEEGNQKFEAVQARGAETIARLAAEAGIETLVHLSAIGADAASDSDYARTKAAGEKAVRDALPGAVIMRPSIIFGPEDKFFNRFAAMATIPVAPLPLIGGGKTRFQPVYVDDVADAICEALENSAHRGRTFELAGPKVYSFRELMDFILKETGRHNLKLPLPFFAAGLMGAGGDIANALPLISAPITSDQVKLLKKDNIAGMTSEENIGMLSDLGIEAETVEAIVPDYLIRFRKYGQFSEATA